MNKMFIFAAVTGVAGTAGIVVSAVHETRKRKARIEAEGPCQKGIVGKTVDFAKDYKMTIALALVVTLAVVGFVSEGQKIVAASNTASAVALGNSLVDEIKSAKSPEDIKAIQEKLLGPDSLQDTRIVDQNGVEIPTVTVNFPFIDEGVECPASVFTNGRASFQHFYSQTNCADYPTFLKLHGVPQNVLDRILAENPAIGKMGWDYNRGSSSFITVVYTTEGLSTYDVSFMESDTMFNDISRGNNRVLSNILL